MGGPNTEAQESRTDPEPSAEETLQHLLLQLRELAAYVSHFVRVKLDELKLSGRQIALWVVIGGLSTVTLISVIVISVALILSGGAIGLGVAIRQTLTEIKKTAKSASDVSALTQQYPWIAVGASALAGFMASTVVVPASRPRHASKGETSPKSRSVLFSFIMSSLLSIFKGPLIRAVANAMRSPSEPEPESSQSQGTSQEATSSYREEGRDVEC